MFSSKNYPYPNVLDFLRFQLDENFALKAISKNIPLITNVTMQPHIKTN